ncbi:MAG: hypothetical protein JW714_01045 [Candidatus Omnitrophica bacterium]|nr:hypothetical protein [Candidatus Omnitrophota bacterium]
MRNVIRPKGQSTLEYVIILTALAVAFLAGVTYVRQALIGTDPNATGGLIGQAADTIPEFTKTLPGVPPR